MRRSTILGTVIIMFIFGSILLPTVNADTLRIGKKVSETDEGDTGWIWHYFDSGCVLEAESECIDYIPSIFDGNLTTGLDHDFGSLRTTMYIEIMFPYTLNVSNITVKPKFNGTATLYSLTVIYKNLYFSFTDSSNTEGTFQINGKLDGIRLYLDAHLQTNSHHFYFNDIIINYTSSSVSNKTQNQINKINQEINSIYNDIFILKNDIIDIRANITNIKNKMPSEYNDSALQGKINNLTQEIDSLKENLTRINNSIPMEYNDSSLKSNIFNLESENELSKQRIGNLTIKIENLTTEIEKLTEEIKNLKGTSNEQAGDQEDKKLDQNSLNIVFIVILIMLLLVILKLSLMILKRKHEEIKEPKTDDILISKITHDMLTDYKIKDTNLSDDDYKIMLDKKYQKGEMSKNTYNYIQNVLENLRKIQKKP